MTNDLKAADLFPTMKGPNGEYYGGALLFRDLLRNCDAGVCSTEEFCAHLRALTKKRGLNGLRKRIATSKEIKAIIKGGINNAALDFSNLPLRSGVSVNSVLGKTPLLLFLLCEADFFTQGRRLGPVGSILYADVFYRALARDVKSVGPRDANWEAVCENAARRLMGDPPPRFIDLAHRIIGLG